MAILYIYSTCWHMKSVFYEHQQEYSRLQDLTQETYEKITLDILVKHLEDIFQDTSSWPTDEQVRSNHIRVERDLVRHPCIYQYYYLLKILYLVCLNAGFG
jgi:hypothetical protein